MVKPTTERRFHQLFEIGILLKGVNAVIEIVLGLALIFTSQFSDLLSALVENELLDDPSDFIARHIDRITQILNPHFQFYAALYLLGHGIVKAVIVWGLLKQKLWAFPAALGVLILIDIYQVVKILQFHSVLLAALTAFDVIIIILVWHEYRRLMRELQ